MASSQDEKRLIHFSFFFADLTPKLRIEGWNRPLGWICAMTEREIFLDALKQPSASERAAFLDQACGSDANLRGQIEARAYVRFAFFARASETQ